MRVVIQRVKSASVTIDNKKTAQINQGILLLLGVESADTDADIEWLCGKIARLRIFDDEHGVMNKSLVDVNGEALVVSQFTLHASVKKGNRPSYIRAAKPEFSDPMYKAFVRVLQNHLNKTVQTGEFGAMMQVELINNGPVTLIIDSKNRDF